MGFLLGAVGYGCVLTGAVWVGWNAIGRPRRHGAATDLLVAAWIGWYVQATVVLGLGWLGLLTPSWLALILLVPLGALFLDRAAAGSWLGGAAADYADTLRAPWWVVAPAVAAVLFLAVQLAAPPFHYDLLTYGFGQPAHWLAEGRIAALGPDMYAYEAVPSRMHFVLGLGLFGHEMASFGIFCWTLAGGLLLARTIRVAAGRPTPWALVGFVALAVTPALWDLVLLRKDDPSALWGGAALLLLAVGLRAEDTRLTAGRTAALALTAAATLAAKPGVTAGFVVALVALVWLADRRGGRLPWKQGLVIAGLVAAALVPIAIHTWLGLGHPLAAAFPHLSRYDIESTRWHEAMADAYPFEPQPLARMVPYALSELGRFYDFRRWNFGDDYGLLVLLGLPLAALLAVVRRRGSPLPRGLWIVLGAGLAGWFFTFHWPRFALVLLPLVLLLVLEVFRARVPAQAAAAAVVVIGLAHAGFYTGLTVTGAAVFRPALVAAVSGDPVERLPFVPPSVEICEEANARLFPAEHRILFVGETRAWPCRIPFDFWNAHFRHPFERIDPDGGAPEAQWERHLAARGITHVIYSPEVARRRMEWSPAMHDRFERWLTHRSAAEPLRAADGKSTTFLVTLRPVETVAARP